MYDPYNVMQVPYTSLNPLQRPLTQPFQNYPHYEIPKVSGKEGAEAFQMGPNSSIFLMDQTSEGIVIYMVTTDSAGFKTITQIDGMIHQDVPVLTADEQFGGRLDEMSKKLEDLEYKFSKFEEIMK